MNIIVKKRISIVVFIIGIITLIAGVIFLILRLTAQPGIQDGEYLVSIGEWQEADEPSVVWNFTEIGKGTLTTNNHLNDYEFIWALEDGKLKIETEWLYTMDNEFEYSLDQSNNTLKLTDGDETIEFIPNKQE